MNEMTEIFITAITDSYIMKDIISYIGPKTYNFLVNKGWEFSEQNNEIYMEAANGIIAFRLVKMNEGLFLSSHVLKQNLFTIELPAIIGEWHSSLVEDTEHKTVVHGEYAHEYTKCQKWSDGNRTVWRAGNRRSCR
jgi:hypothetical protein